MLEILHSAKILTLGICGFSGSGSDSCVLVGSAAFGGKDKKKILKGKLLLCIVFLDCTEYQIVC